MWFSLKFLSFNLSLSVFSFFSVPSGAKGGGQEIKELPRGSPSVHISVGARENGTEGVRERRRGVRVASALGSCSSSLFHCFLAVILFLRYVFDQSVHIFNFNVSYNCCKKIIKKHKNISNKKEDITSKSVLFCSIVNFYKVLFVSFLCC